MKLKFIKLKANAKAPTYGSVYAAGADLYACLEGDMEIPPHETKLIPTGIAMQIPEGYAGFIYARSGLATKRSLAPANCVGVVDSDYRGEVMVALHNHSNNAQTVGAFERIAQMVIAPYLAVEYTEVKSLTETERGAGGFGSTGTK